MSGKVTKEDIEKVEKKLLKENEHHSHYSLILLALVAFLLVASAAYWVILNPPEFNFPSFKEPPAPIPVVEEVVEEVTIPVSSVLAAIRTVDQQVTVDVYLRHGSFPLPRGGGVYTEIVVDDADTEWLVTGLTPSQKRMFPTRDTTAEMYTVTGILRDLDRGLTLDVDSIE